MLSNTCVVKSVSSKTRYFRQSLFIVFRHLDWVFAQIDRDTLKGSHDYRAL